MDTPDSRWTEDRLASLEPPAAWRPDASRALAHLRIRQRAYRRRIAGIILGAVAAVLACMVLMTASAPQACATPTSCAEHFWQKVFPKHPATEPSRPAAALFPV